MQKDASRNLHGMVEWCNEEIPETSREILLKIGARIYEKEEEALSFSEFVKIRKTLAHRYLDIKWNDIKKFMQLAPKLYPPFLNYIIKKYLCRKNLQ